MRFRTPRTRIAALKKQMAKQAAQHREDAPRARAALLEAIDQQLGFVSAFEFWWMLRFRRQSLTYYIDLFLQDV